MASATYWQRGEALDYVNNTSNMIKVGTVLKIGTRIGIAGDDIAPKATGAIHVSGVYEFKKTGTNEVKMGTNVYFDGRRKEVIPWQVMLLKTLLPLQQLLR